MFEVEITNYESITHTKLKVEGFTTLIGRNYLGKSSVLRAINAALTNKEGTEFISWGQTFCEVHLIFPDLDILWHKEEGNNFYIINGKEYNKVGKGEPPQEILDAGFKPVVVGDQKLNLNYAVQFFPLFLVNKRDSKSADLLTSVYGLDRIYKAIDLCNKEQRTNSDLLRIREKDLKLIDGGLEKYKDFPGIISKVPDLKNKRKELGEKEEEITKIKSWGSSLSILMQANKKLRPVSEISVPVSDNISKNIKEYQAIERYKSNFDLLMGFLRKIKPVLDISLPDKFVPEIKGTFSEYQRLAVWDNNHNKLVGEVSRLKNIQEVVLPTSEIMILLSEYQKLLIWSNSYKKLVGEVGRLEKVKSSNLPTHKISLEDIPKLQLSYSQIVSLSNEVKSIKAMQDKINVEISDTEKEISTFDLCPLCGKKRE